MNHFLRIILAQPRGFCAGVERAIETVERALQKFGSPVYVRHEIVHNRYVVENLRKKGAVFVNELDEIPAGSITIFSAHGVSEHVEHEAKLRQLPVIDATCPLVTKVHKEAQRHEKEGLQVILIGHPGHPEVEGTSGRVEQEVLLVSSLEEVDHIIVQDPSRLAYVTQTTLSVDDTRHIIDRLKERFPLIQGPDLRDICYATQNRQNAVRQLSKMVELILVIGAENSSNSNRLRDMALEMGCQAYLIHGAKDLNPLWFSNVNTVGITAGASAPEVLVDEVVSRLSEWKNGQVKLETMDGILEKIKFKLPDEVM
jgi:4-hydroxy-3-methylbut-2-enyl diphosphate reductase